MFLEAGRIGAQAKLSSARIVIPTLVITTTMRNGFHAVSRPNSPEIDHSQIQNKSILVE